MTKKDYQAIARAIHGARKSAEAQTHLSTGTREWAVWGVSVATEGIVDVLAADNPRFDRARFMEACETGRCKGMLR